MSQRFNRRKFLWYGTATFGTSLLLKACASQPSIPQASSPSPTASVSASPVAERFRVAIVLPGPITDNGWNQAGYEAMGIVKLNLKTETAYVEKVPQADQVEVLSDFARRDFKMIIAHGGQFEAAVKQVAAQFPESFFVVSDGVVTGKNIASLQVDHLQIAYLAGTVAGQMTESNKVAFLTAQSFTTTDQERRGFELGAKSVNPKVEVKASYTNDWNDVGKAKEATTALLAAGVDVVYNMLDAAAPGVLQTLSDKGAYAIGYFEDQLNLAPKTVLTSAVQDYGLAIASVAEIARSKGLEGKIYKMGLDKPNILRLGKFSTIVPEDVQKRTMQAKEAIVTQKIKFEDCQVNGKPNWCVKGTGAS
ncbi:BMP family protein [Kovacikia minuta CCNUW1]|uniref:BMP family protein n=1 Tax=Kovacikia minuta TaxID=2931930 RepID=UPI001CCA96FC|nr:BMP family protein [Kovacikia minuta]UBF26131.1 BMP family protein [Kovacikia minuta CCNUW1]